MGLAQLTLILSSVMAKRQHVAERNVIKDERLHVFWARQKATEEFCPIHEETNRDM